MDASHCRAWESCRTHVRNAAVYALLSFVQEMLRGTNPTSGGPRPTALLADRLIGRSRLWSRLKARN
jgi:hypothetical protein